MNYQQLYCAPPARGVPLGHGGEDDSPDVEVQAHTWSKHEQGKVLTARAAHSS
jgi:hypothetical protein